MCLTCFRCRPFSLCNCKKYLRKVRPHLTLDLKGNQALEVRTWKSSQPGTHTSINKTHIVHHRQGLLKGNLNSSSLHIQGNRLQHLRGNTFADPLVGTLWVMQPIAPCLQPSHSPPPICLSSPVICTQGEGRPRKEPKQG